MTTSPTTSGTGVQVAAAVGGVVRLEVRTVVGVGVGVMEELG